MARRLSFSCLLHIKHLVISNVQTNGEGLWFYAGGQGKPMNVVISLMVLEHGLIAVMHLSVACPIPPIPGLGGGKDGN